mmetsp:Transcript_96364/g.251123  ORF Transcript_96364/g.251123 Transcript_96364/m.251123 type:complete len:217 (+) Transcript_96364:316-966(+)
MAARAARGPVAAHRWTRAAGAHGQEGRFRGALAVAVARSEQRWRAPGRRAWRAAVARRTAGARGHVGGRGAGAAGPLSAGEAVREAGPGEGLAALPDPRLAAPGGRELAVLHRGAPRARQRQRQAHHPPRLALRRRRRRGPRGLRGGRHPERVQIQGRAAACGLPRVHRVLAPRPGWRAGRARGVLPAGAGRVAPLLRGGPVARGRAPGARAVGLP